MTEPVQTRRYFSPRLLVAGMAVAGLLAVPALAPTPLIGASAAYAAEDGHTSGGHSSGSRGGGHDTGSMHTDGHTDDGDDGHTDSDHGKKGPGYRGGSGSKGGGHAGSGSQQLVDSVFRGKGRDNLDSMQGGSAGKGSLYGDLYVILRESDGSPDLDEFGRVQFVDAEGNVIPYQSDEPDAEGFGEVADEAALQEVEFERLNVGRAPASVLAHALAEAERTIGLDADGVLERDAAGRLIIVDADGASYTIDSPLENLSLYQEALESDGWTLADAAAFLGAASSKTKEITVDTVVYLNSILGINNPDDGYYDLGGFSYDRAARYPDTVTYLSDPDGDGVYTEVTRPIMDVVFESQDYSGSGAEAFATAADDARAVIEFVHEPIH
ncbi:hypothetical protein LV476_04015 [Guyparkeria hydrothermalis]|uniref:hypothetical protein n=1 Tax=Guyparkeria hydrothermalis TaxID=923 RepID=UPI002021D0D1|nr:hypothetical protein [Guyparkeria hydrothermalis]MCL7744118.1 hypothetical protein [Guyparkeria hydrothermalis]